MLPCALIIPARLSSQRFPKKLLHPILGKPLILWTAENLSNSDIEWPIFFAVEDDELAITLEDAGHKVVKTGVHSSGTDRLAEANKSVNAKLVINIQADEPLTSIAHVKQLHGLMSEGIDMGTLAHRIESYEDFSNPNRVKVVCDNQCNALYFSRSPIPFPRETPDALPQSPALLHLGMYAYTAEFLDAFTQLPPSNLEQIEKLEQLRALENGYKIKVGVTDHLGFGVDAPEDARALEQKLAAM